MSDDARRCATIDDANDLRKLMIPKENECSLRTDRQGNLIVALALCKGRAARRTVTEHVALHGRSRRTVDRVCKGKSSRQFTLQTSIQGRYEHGRVCLCALYGRVDGSCIGNARRIRLEIRGPVGQSVAKATARVLDRCKSSSSRRHGAHLGSGRHFARVAARSTRVARHARVGNWTSLERSRRACVDAPTQHDVCVAIRRNVRDAHRNVGIFRLAHVHHRHGAHCRRGQETSQDGLPTE